ncbi:MAG: phenylacetate--CoA ligase family protein [Planctomycetota bacterium]
MIEPVKHVGESWRLDTDSLREIQLVRLNQVLAAAIEHPFYRERLSGLRFPLQDLESLHQIPFLTKEQMINEAPGLPAKIFGGKKGDYRYFHQTSGTSGRPMPVLDTAADWEWWMRCWAHVLHAATVDSTDIAMMAFSFGPFIGFWTASDALRAAGALMIPGGGLSSEARIQMIVDHGCTIVCCTPTYALHLLEAAAKVGIDLAATDVSRLIVAGEPGGSLPSVRQRIESGWGARVVDHSGGSEIGAWGFGSRDGQGLHVIETEFIAECLVFDDGETDPFPAGRPAENGERSELVLTGLGRFGGPAIRYRTGDMVRPLYDDPKIECRFLYLDGGVLGRADDMIVIRGVNVFPSSIEAIVREIDPVAEFRMIVKREGEMDSVTVEAELSVEACEHLAGLLQSRLAMRIPVRCVEAESLPRFSAKARRLVRESSPPIR